MYMYLWNFVGITYLSWIVANFVMHIYFVCTEVWNLLL